MTNFRTCQVKFMSIPSYFILWEPSLDLSGWRTFWLYDMFYHVLFTISNLASLDPVTFAICSWDGQTKLGLDFRKWQ